MSLVVLKCDDAIIQAKRNKRNSNYFRCANALAYQGMNYMTYVIGLLHRIEDSVSVTFPDLPGCIAQGDTIEAALENARKAVAFHVEGLFQNGETAPELHTLDALYADPQFAEDFANNAKVALVPLKLPAASA